MQYKQLLIFNIHDYKKQVAEGGMRATFFLVNNIHIFTCYCDVCDK